MTQVTVNLSNAAEPQAVAPNPGAAKSRVDELLHCSLLVGLGLLTLGVAGYDFHLLKDYPFLRTQVLVAEIAAGAGAAASFGGAMHFADRLSATRDAAGQRLKWYWRWALGIGTRLMMLAQIAATGLIVLGAASFLFQVDKKLMPPEDDGPGPQKPSIILM